MFRAFPFQIKRIRAFLPKQIRGMDLQKILAISGKPGLYKLLSSNAASIIVESLVDGKRMPIHAAHKISSLEDISIYTYSEDIPLEEVFTKIGEKEDGGLSLTGKESAAERRAYMEEILPEYDEDRVYDSDLKKLFKWYNMLNELGLLIPSEEETSNDDDDNPVVEDAEIIEESSDEKSESQS